MTGPTFTEHQLTLVRKKFTAQLAISPELVELSTATDWLTDRLVMQARIHVFGEELPPHTETRTVRVPDGWWQHYRHDHAEKRWMRRSIRKHPVRMREITLTATWENMAAYPWADLRTQPVPGYLGAAVRLSWMTSELRWDGEDA